MRRTAVFVALTIGVAACSGSDASESSGPGSAATAVPDVVTTVAVTEPAVTTPATTSPTTTVSPTTTIDEAARLAGAEAAYIESWEAYHAAIHDPANPKLRAEIERTSTADAYEATVNVLDGFVEAGIAARVNPELEASTRIVSEPLFVPDETELADVIICEVNSEWYFEIGTRPDGGDALFRDDVFVVRSLVRLEWIDERWVYRSSEVLSEQVGVFECVE